MRSCSSPVPGSAPYRTRSAASIQNGCSTFARTDALRFWPPPRRRPDRAGDACPASSPPARRRRNPCSPGACPHPGSPRRPMPPSRHHAAARTPASRPPRWRPSSPSCAPDPIRRPPRYAPSIPKYPGFPSSIMRLPGTLVSLLPLGSSSSDGAQMLASTIVPVFNRPERPKCLISSNNPIPKPCVSSRSGSSGSSSRPAKDRSGADPQSGAPTPPRRADSSN